MTKRRTLASAVPDEIEREKAVPWVHSIEHLLCSLLEEKKYSVSRNMQKVGMYFRYEVCFLGGKIDSLEYLIRKSMAREPSSLIASLVLEKSSLTHLMQTSWFWFAR